jgi:hypothetical protein
MKKFTLLSLILSLSIFLSGCSYRVSFIIENLSHSSIVVKYEAKKPNWNDLTPYVKNLNEINNREKSWEKPTEDKYKFDKEKGFVEVTIEPNQALQVTSVDPFWTYHEPYGDHFNIKMLSIFGQNGSIQIEGNQVFEIFEPQKVKFNLFGPGVSGYIFRYKESESHDITK